jgi:soluble lytic murein transglycosylase
MDERRERLTEAHLHLTNALRLGGDGAVPAAVARELYDRLQEAGLADLGVDTLRALRRIDPADTAGATGLWERGWNAYRAGDDRGAIAAWELLREIYPESGEGHRGLYWQARALARSGEGERANALYRELVASSDTADFYGRQAMVELGREPGPAWAGERVRSAVPWRIDPLLKEAKLLTDLGLDDLAERAMDLAGKRANARDLLALKALLLGRRGDQAGSMILLREAFPALGTAYQSTVPQEILYAYYPLEFGDAIRASAAEEHLPTWLVAGVIRQESAFNPRATSRSGARGLMQLMPETAAFMARQLGLRYKSGDLYNPQVSLRLGTAYLRQLIEGFHGNLELALAGYNGGPSRIERLWQEAGPTARLDDFVENLALDESKGYVKRILVLADSYRQLYPEAG